MKNITVSVTDRFHRRLCRMSKEMPGEGGLGTITREALKTAVARDDAKTAALRKFFMQEVDSAGCDQEIDQGAPLRTLLERIKTAPPCKRRGPGEEDKGTVGNRHG